MQGLDCEPRRKVVPLDHELDVELAARIRKIERHHERRAPRLIRTPNEALDEASVAHHMELKPKWFRGVGSHVLDRADAHGRQAERYPEGLGGAGRKVLSVGVLHAAESSGARATGMPTSSPIIVDLTDRFSIFTATRCRKQIAARSRSLARYVLSVQEPEST
jgi:hypothetical protein